jgi:hypothetical protein
LKPLLWALLMFGALLAHGCAGSSFQGEQPTEWSASPVREQFPVETAGVACLTVWAISGDGCAVSDEPGGDVLECAAGPNPLVLNAVPDRFGTCIIGIRPCEEGRCQ